MYSEIGVEAPWLEDHMRRVTAAVLAEQDAASAAQESADGDNPAM